MILQILLHQINYDIKDNFHAVYPIDKFINSKCDKNFVDTHFEYLEKILEDSFSYLHILYLLHIY